jgi:hypothetical protein
MSWNGSKAFVPFAAAQLLALAPISSHTPATAPISSHVQTGCFPAEGFVERIISATGARSAWQFPLGIGFIAVYADGSWLHVAEFERPCVVATGAREDMATYFETEE